MLYPIELRTHGRMSIANPIGVTRRYLRRGFFSVRHLEAPP